VTTHQPNDLSSHRPRRAWRAGNAAEHTYGIAWSTGSGSGQRRNDETVITLTVIALAFVAKRPR
jgi:hypothetical protein